MSPEEEYKMMMRNFNGNPNMTIKEMYDNEIQNKNFHLTRLINANENQQKQINKLNNKINKAIEYIKSNKMLLCGTDTLEVLEIYEKNLLDILEEIND